MMDRSRAVFSKGFIRLRPIAQFKGISHFFIEPLGMLEDACKTSHSSSADVHNILDAVVAAIHRAHTAQRTGIEAVLDALRAVWHGFRDITQLGGVADRCASPPAAVPAGEVSEAAGLIRSPLVDAHGHMAGTLTAAETGEDLLAGVHWVRKLQIKLY